METKGLVGKIAALAGIAILGGSLYAGRVSAGVSGSDHDFSGKTWNSSGELCITCHTPHDADPYSAGVNPLWNHELSASTFTMYTSPTIDNAIDTAPNDYSKLCLGCHDGSIALENFGGATGGTNFIGSGETVGPNLTKEHPISIVYDETIDTGLKTQPTTLPFYSDKVECATCHDVHSGSGYSKLLRISNAASALCTTCHDK